MTNEQIFDKLREIVVDKLACPGEDVVMTTNFIEDLGADSLYLNEIVYEMEEQFGIKVADSDFEKLRTIEQAVNYISEKVN